MVDPSWGQNGPRGWIDIDPEPLICARNWACEGPAASPMASTEHAAGSLAVGPPSLGGAGRLLGGRRTMAQRGMLPKIRKTAQSAQPVARPTIRPVRVTKAPPPPAPPRKFPSGVAPRGSHEQYSEPPVAEPIYAEPREIITKNGYEDPPTMSAEHSAPAPSTMRFDDETQMRQPDGRLIAATRDRQSAHQVNERHHDRDDETMARPNPGTIPYFPPRDERADQQIRHEHVPQQQQQNDIYDSLPSLEMRRPYDTYEREFEERDPETQAGLRDRDDHRDDRGHAEHYPTPHAEHYPAPHEEHYPSAPKTEAAPQREHREGSGARERPRHQSSKRLREVYDDSGEQHAHDHQPPPTKQPEAAPRYEDPVIPPAPRVPAGFIVGVQPIRPQNNGQNNGASFRVDESFPPYAAPQTQAPPMQSPRAMHAPVQAPMQHAPVHAHNAYGTPSMQQGMHQQPAYANMHRHNAMPYAQAVVPHAQQAPMGPVGHQLQEPPPSSTSKTLRFAWFVFGVAFGIGFTFFASGVVPGLKREEPAPTASAAPSASFPPPAPILSNAPPPVQAPQVAPPVQAPPVQAPAAQAQAPAPPPVLAPPPAVATASASAATVTPGQLPAVKQQQVAPPSVQPRVASAPPPRTRRASAPSGGGGGAPKALPNSGSVEASADNDGPSASSSRGGGGGESSSAPAKTASVPSGADLFGAALGN